MQSPRSPKSPKSPPPGGSVGMKAMAMIAARPDKNDRTVVTGDRRRSAAVVSLRQRGAAVPGADGQRGRNGSLVAAMGLAKVLGSPLRRASIGPPPEPTEPAPPPPPTVTTVWTSVNPEEPESPEGRSSAEPDDDYDPMAAAVNACKALVATTQGHRDEIAGVRAARFAELRRKEALRRWDLLRKLVHNMGKHNFADGELDLGHIAQFSRYQSLREAISTPPAFRSKQHIATIADIIKGLTFFKACRLSTHRRRMLCRNMTLLSYPTAHHFVFQVGDVGKSFFVVLVGGVLVQVPDKKNFHSMKTVAHLRCGDSFGEMALLTPGGIRTGTTVTSGPTQLLEISKADYELVIRPEQIKWFDEKVQFLQHVSCFDGVSEELLRSLAHSVNLVTVPLGYVVSVEGQQVDNARFFTMVQVGAVKITRKATTLDGRPDEMELAEFGPNTAVLPRVTMLSTNDPLKSIVSARTTMTSVLGFVSRFDIRARLPPDVYETVALRLAEYPAGEELSQLATDKHNWETYKSQLVHQVRTDKTIRAQLASRGTVVKPVPDPSYQPYKAAVPRARSPSCVITAGRPSTASSLRSHISSGASSLNGRLSRAPSSGTLSRIDSFRTDMSRPRTPQIAPNAAAAVPVEDVAGLLQPRGADGMLEFAYVVSDKEEGAAGMLPHVYAAWNAPGLPPSPTRGRAGVLRTGSAAFLRPQSAVGRPKTAQSRSTAQLHR